MTQRSMIAGLTPTVIIKAGTSVTVEGREGSQVVAETGSRGGLKVEARDENEIGRARAAVGDRVLFDLRLKLPVAKGKGSTDAIEVQIGGSGRVQVPLGSRVKVYAGKDAELNGVQGGAAIYAGGSVRTRAARSLVHVSAGGSLDLECDTIEGHEVRFEAGRDLRFYARQLVDARIVVTDLGGTWEGVIGAGMVIIRLKAGGDAVLVTDQKVEAMPPDYMLGQVEPPGVSPGLA